jgi:hypothetical protein
LTDKTSLAMPLFIEVPVPGIEIEQSCILVLRVSIATFISTIILFDCGTIPTVVYHFIDIS